MSLKEVTEDICAQAGKKVPDVKKLTELYIFRGIFGIVLWFACKKDPSKKKSLAWYETTALSFVDGYDTSAKLSTSKVGTDHCNSDDGVLSWANTLLLKIVTPC